MAKSSRAICGGAIFSAVFWSKSIPTIVLISCNSLRWYWEVFFSPNAIFVLLLFGCPQLNGFFSECICSKRQKKQISRQCIYNFLALHVHHQSNGDESVLERELMFDFLLWYIKREIHREMQGGVLGLSLPNIINYQ